ncbi:helix-turn-helix domain-containing protein [Lysinibacillus sp. G4S2]|uniref:helix-turn-helix domain-containing protein n=1 Tax=Lysinibacillus sp. G4S2 TaxID=3055859 RepID=UPI0025A1B2C1|nr:helix-turn-helix domain-containing protein [Lysinibacillus sp. G4S2]MDM5250104.1 helix-turn-helix domain-containing protein [Lysinibacillus sp. G4S2]
MDQLINNIETLNSIEIQIKNWITDAMKGYHTPNNTTKEWMSIKEACDYIGVAHNTFMKYREMGLKVCEIEGVKRVSKSEIDNFLNKFSC